MYTPIQTIHGVNSYARKVCWGAEKMCLHIHRHTNTTTKVRTTESATKPWSNNSSVYNNLLAYKIYWIQQQQQQKTDTKWYPGSLLWKQCVYRTALMSSDRRFNVNEILHKTIHPKWTKVKEVNQYEQKKKTKHARDVCQSNNNNHNKTKSNENFESSKRYVTVNLLWKSDQQKTKKSKS